MWNFPKTRVKFQNPKASSRTRSPTSGDRISMPKNIYSCGLPRRSQNYKRQNGNIRFPTRLHIRVALPQWRIFSRWEIDELSSTPPTMHTPSGAPRTTPVVAYTLSLYLLGQSVGEGVGGGRGAELVKPPNYWRNLCTLNILAANVLSPFRLPFLLLSVLSFIILWGRVTARNCG